MLTKVKTKAKTGRRQAIERVCDNHDGGAEVSVDGALSMIFKRVESFDYFLVNTNNFLPSAAAGSVIEVYMRGGDNLKPYHVVLAANGGRLEILPYSKCKGAQVLGQVTEVRTWPGQVVENYTP